MNDKQWTSLARDFQRAVARVAPDWTGTGEHDPGIAMLELLAFVLDNLQHRRVALNPQGRLLARDLASRASALATTIESDSDDCGSGLRRVNYRAGMLLGVDDFQAEQDYVRDRLNRRNRLLYGAGIVAGLAVTVQANAGGARVVIAPGLAFAPGGNEIFLDTPCVLALPASGAAWIVQLVYRERPCQSARIVETFDATLASVPAVDAVAVARVHRVRGQWRVDAKFKAPRTRG